MSYYMLPCSQRPLSMWNGLLFLWFIWCLSYANFCFTLDMQSHTGCSSEFYPRPIQAWALCSGLHWDKNSKLARCWQKDVLTQEIGNTVAICFPCQYCFRRCSVPCQGLPSRNTIRKMRDLVDVRRRQSLHSGLQHEYQTLSFIP